MPSASSSIARTHELMARARDVLAYGGVYSILEHAVEYPGGAFPQLAETAEGYRILDTSGTEYIDWRNGWGSVILGHRRAEVEAAILAQLQAGPKLSLMHPIEVEVAERIRAMVPCAEKVAFGKNGSDATLAAVRLARAYTRRDVIVQCGFHGFHDWYAGLQPTCDGIPAAVRELTVSFPENDLPALEKVLRRYRGRVAAVMIEPASYSEPGPGYLESVKSLAHGQGALLVFDEVVTSFRVARGGAQEAYGVVPDIACLGKAMSNGMPLSAVVGRRDVMQTLPRIGFSMTYQGETLSLAAARATLDVHQTHPVAAHLARIGTRVREQVEADARTLGIACSLVGPPARLRFAFAPVGVFSSRGLLTLFLQECLKRGILTDGSLYTSYAHDDAAVEQSTTAFRESLTVVRAAIEARRLEPFLHVPTEPGFYVSETQQTARSRPPSIARRVWRSVRAFGHQISPLVHYLRHGGSEGQNPHPLFDEAYYLDNNPDVRDALENNPDAQKAGLSPLVHYLRHGGLEGRSPHPLFDGKYYLDNNPDVRESGANPLTHFLQVGGLEGRSPHPLFDAQYYLDSNADVRAAKANPLVHYLVRGGLEGRNPHPLFDGQYYLDSNPDVREAGMNPLVHYVQRGAEEGRNPHPLFDTACYLDAKPNARW